jgi:hypothetical protein
MVLGCGGCSQMAQRWWEGKKEAVCLQTRGWEGRVWAKNLKLSCCGSVIGVLCEMVMGSGAGTW